VFKTERLGSFLALRHRRAQAQARPPATLGKV
jgi:hypothetical protein